MLLILSESTPFKSINEFLILTCQMMTKLSQLELNGIRQTIECQATLSTLFEWPKIQPHKNKATGGICDTI